jgi:hypothetical protein
MAGMDASKRACTHARQSATQPASSQAVSSQHKPAHSMNGLHCRLTGLFLVTDVAVGTIVVGAGDLCRQRTPGQRSSGQHGAGDSIQAKAQAGSRIPSMLSPSLSAA